MRIARTIQDLELDRSSRIGLVPTMGAFHEGHLELMRVARAECETVVASLFVNPLQFGPSEDLAKYPRNEERDFDLARGVGVDVMFAPVAGDFVAGTRTSVRVEGVSSRWEGARRPGHFDGVATIVAKLFNIVQPDFAFFGLKDFQQCAVISSMVKDLSFRLGLRFIETVRESDGLALSSRNQYLSPEHRTIAPEIYRTLVLAGSRLKAEPVDSVLESSTRALEQCGFDVDYLALIDSLSLEPLSTTIPGARLICAAQLGNTWLIDNIGI